MKFASFDLETCNLAPANLNSGEKLGISCASVYLSGAKLPNLFWNGRDIADYSQGEPMTAGDCAELVDFIATMTARGYAPLAWNGLGFDFRVLGQESGLVSACATLALKAYDPMFQLFCIKGFPLGMDNACKGMNVKGKTEGMDGSKAPEMWRNGTEADRQKVLEYVGQDTKATLDLTEAIIKERGVYWTSKSNRPMNVRFERLLTVEQCLELPLPDTAWMTKSADREPMSRETFAGWMLQALQNQPGEIGF